MSREVINWACADSAATLYGLQRGVVELFWALVALQIIALGFQSLCFGFGG